MSFVCGAGATTVQYIYIVHVQDNAVADRSETIIVTPLLLGLEGEVYSKSKYDLMLQNHLQIHHYPLLTTDLI